jgi:threonine/homoserine/homoserine lactone efflux protein
MIYEIGSREIYGSCLRRGASGAMFACTIMIQFVLSLIPLAAIDGSSAARPAILAVIMGSREKPVFCGAMYVLGTFVVYMIIGLLFVLGLGAWFEKMAEGAGGGAIDRIVNPEEIDYYISFVIGVLLLFGAWKISRPSKEKGPKKESKGFTPGRAFVLGAASNAIVGPGILPSFAAYNQMMKSSFSAPEVFVLLVVYNFMVVSLLVFLVWLRAVNEERAERVFAGIARFFSTWGKRVVVFLFCVLGLVMIADSAGFFMGHPLIPTGSPKNGA